MSCIWAPLSFAAFCPIVSRKTEDARARPARPNRRESSARMTAPPASAPPAIDIAATIERARAAWRAGRADEAEMACRQVLAVWPGQGDAMQLLGLMAYAYGNLDLAIAHLRHACQSPRAPAVYFSDFAEMCRQGGLLAEAEQAARRAVALDPNLAGARNN